MADDNWKIFLLVQRSLNEDRTTYPYLNMTIFQKWPPLSQKCHFGASHRVENNFLVIVVDVHNSGITVGFGLQLHSVWSLTQGWSASPCVVTIQFDRSSKPTTTLINRPQRIWEKYFPLCEEPQNGAIMGEVKVSFLCVKAAQYFICNISVPTPFW